MFRQLQKPKGQGIGEYSLTLAAALIAVMGMMFFIQRALRARVHDVRVYTAETLAQETLRARAYREGWVEPGFTGGISLPNAYSGMPGVFYEYEPYYRRSQAIVDRELIERDDFSQGHLASQRESHSFIQSYSEELPARDDFWKPAYEPNATLPGVNATVNATVNGTWRD